MGYAKQTGIMAHGYPSPGLSELEYFNTVECGTIDATIYINKRHRNSSDDFNISIGRDLSNNQITGDVNRISTATRAEVINLANNRLQGTLPSLATLTNLKTLDLSSNPGITGQIPALPSPCSAPGVCQYNLAGTGACFSGSNAASLIAGTSLCSGGSVSASKGGSPTPSSPGPPGGSAASAALDSSPVASNNGSSTSTSGQGPVSAVPTGNVVLGVGKLKSNESSSENVDRQDKGDSDTNENDSTSSSGASHDSSAMDGNKVIFIIGGVIIAILVGLVAFLSLRTCSKPDRKSFVARRFIPNRWRGSFFTTTSSDISSIRSARFRPWQKLPEVHYAEPMSVDVTVPKTNGAIPTFVSPPTRRPLVKPDPIRMSVIVSDGSIMAPSSAFGGNEDGSSSIFSGSARNSSVVSIKRLYTTSSSGSNPGFVGRTSGDGSMPVLYTPVSPNWKRMAKRNPELLLLFIDEYNTSQVCSKCNAHEIHLEHLHEKGDDRPGRKGSKIWAVKLCLVCGTVWDRDVQVGLYITHNGERPYAFKRPPAKLQGDRVQAADSDAVPGTGDNR
ncbi:hypothetical protein HK102_002928 [Quaeritorhiza haematococci]|nr:hypothetical protein HK102_002928 [Quaeritorhiza haematococci]